MVMGRYVREEGLVEDKIKEISDSPCMHQAFLLFVFQEQRGAVNHSETSFNIYDGVDHKKCHKQQEHFIRPGASICGFSKKIIRENLLKQQNFRSPFSSDDKGHNSPALVSMASSSCEAETVNCRDGKGRRPSLIARLMGMEDFPSVNAGSLKKWKTSEMAACKNKEAKKSPPAIVKKGRRSAKLGQELEAAPLVLQTIAVKKTSKVVPVNQEPKNKKMKDISHAKSMMKGVCNKTMTIKQTSSKREGRTSSATLNSDKELKAKPAKELQHLHKTVNCLKSTEDEKLHQVKSEPNIVVATKSGPSISQPEKYDLLKVESFPSFTSLSYSKDIVSVLQTPSDSLQSPSQNLSTESGRENANTSVFDIVPCTSNSDAKSTENETDNEDTTSIVPKSDIAPNTTAICEAQRPDRPSSSGRDSEILMNYNKDGAEFIHRDEVDYLLLRRDLYNSRADVNCMCKLGWEGGVVGADEVVEQLEDHVLSKLIEEIITDYL